ncbi:putrescine--2-oxoglutarate aminotransferase [candidate division KD3-62 bacterium DG_56]|uniref:Putrescine--2-oxoglutarate aminotransferase n=1 Tax=candidate division KD3-62 bacterium DG_56 TaxID=1704032 RepID=A0A0S7XQH8_9BACT|nr:MAG: putrescine--2-oxoglutarate aminotransferase [candidate division KD3-62 bacterium DG_56]
MTATDSTQAADLIEQTIDSYRRHVNAGLASLLKFMGFDTVETEARGMTVRTADGREYLDCLGGYGVYALGHAHPRVVAAVHEQLDRLPMSAKTLFDPVQAQLASRLAELTPGDLAYSFICNSGAEAIEGALKLARLYTGRPNFVAAQNAFHGKTMGALSASGREVFKRPFEPLVPGFTHVPFGAGETMERAVDDQTAAVILEPIQGEAGIILSPDDYLPRVREICSQRGALLILDEVQTGCGRTGRMFCCEHYGVVPDIMTLAKALGGGVMPIGAFISTPEIWKVMEPNPLLHSSTFGGNPLACAAAVAALDVIVEEELPARAAETGDYFIGRLHEIAAQRSDLVTEVRGRGLLIGMEFSEDDVAGLVIAGLAQRGIIAAYTLNNPRVIRLEPPLIITREQVDRVVAALDESIAQTAALLAE